MNIVYAVTRSFYHKILPSLYSLLDHNTDIDLYVVAEDDDLGIDLPIDARVINVSGQTWFKPDDPNYNNRFTYINLIKVCYASILPVDKVLHLDADTIICDDLHPFYDTDLTGKWIGAVQETEASYKPFGPIYYNMGVALLNLEQMRRDNIEPELIEYLNMGVQPWADQDAWNYLAQLDDKFVSINRRYNENQATGKTLDPAIVHYCGVPNWWDSKTMFRHNYLDNVRARHSLGAPL